MSTVQAPAARLKIPKHFGRRSDATFLPAASAEHPALAEAAQVQHHTAVAALDELACRDLSISWLAGELTENTDHLRRKLYGQVPANLRDFCSWGAVLAVETVRAVHYAHTQHPISCAAAGTQPEAAR